MLASAIVLFVFKSSETFIIINCIYCSLVVTYFSSKKYLYEKIAKNTNMINIKNPINIFLIGTLF